ncbi:peptidyl-dipeptidase Dcp [Arcticibacter eurypsychrophilus]|uniref:peptidyl-dipeptidase Dcp n=1 Tax=Arcticibacter eurypsychrophilus TaxID=1434752 RepID=UPI00084DCA82|nr:peptidyl-dipeptidase Dcp [Arcticibacter eurypsychrophilus]
MKQLYFCSLAALLFAISSCGNKEKQSNDLNSFTSSNPFAEVSKLAYQAPDFDKIKDSDFEPAIEEGMKVHLKEVQQISENKEKPDFQNTIEAMEKSGQLLTRVYRIFNLLTGANTNPKLQKVQEGIAPKLAAHQDAIYLNSELFKRVESIYNERQNLSLDAESKRLAEWYYQQFEIAGAKLSDADKIKLKKLNEEEAGLSAKFTNQLLAATKAGSVTVNTKEELAGLSAETQDAAAQDAKAKKLDGKWLISLQNTTQQPDLQSLSNRATRQKLFEASWNRAEKSDSNDTRSAIIRIAKIRANKSALLGFKNYAGWKLQDQMAKTPEAVSTFLGKLVPASAAKVKGDAKELQAVIDQQNGGFNLQPWDWDYYAEQVRKAKFNLDENDVKPYFELNNVLQNGVFYAANLLYGITFKERTDLPVYQKDVRVFELFEKNGQSIGLFYCDYFKRDNKSGGAWMDNMVGQSKLLGTKPVIYNVCNFTKPAAGQPALISFDDVSTMFHEFGHALHGFFANQQYPSISGTSVSRDFVEFPSQFNEHWSLDPKVFKNYAIHYKTKKSMPQALVEKIKKASVFNQAYALTELLAAAKLDMSWHTITTKDSIKNADQFETAALHQAGLDLPQVPPRYRSTYFLHIWGNGYAAGYYAYLWSEMLDDDAYSWFNEHGGLTAANGQRFRDMILSKGNTEDLGTLFTKFRGHSPNIKPLLINRGLIGK